MSRQSGKFARVDPNNPAAFGICDRCGFLYNLRDLTWQVEWAGTNLYNKRILVCTTGNRCYDKPQEQLRTIILPPDPVAVRNPRPPDYAYEEQTAILMQFGSKNPVLPSWGAGPELIMSEQTGEIPMVLQYTTSS